MSFELAFLLIVAAFIIGYTTGAIVSFEKIMRNILSDPDKHIDILMDYKKDIEILKALDNKTSMKTDLMESLEITTLNGTVYLYRKDTQQFMSQGSTVEEALAKIQQPTPIT